MTTLTIILLIIGWLMCGFMGSYWKYKLCGNKHMYIVEFIFLLLLGPITLIAALITYLITLKNIWNKRIFFLLLLVGLFSNCTRIDVHEQTKVPTEIVNHLMKADSTDIIKVYLYEDVGTNKRDYVFNESKQLIKKYNTENIDVALPFPLVLIFTSTLLVIGVLIGINNT